MTSIQDWIFDNPGRAMLIFVGALAVFFAAMIILFPCEGSCPTIIYRGPIGNMPGGVTIIP